jgi:hypothetical protein
MKALLTIALLLAFGVGVWGITATPEQIAEWKEAAENGDAEAIFDGKSLDGWSAVPELNDQIFEALIDISWQVNQRSKL